MVDISNEVIIGSVSALVVGLITYLYQPIHQKIIETIESRRIYNWMLENSHPSAGNTFRSTRTIASHNNLTEERVRYLCSKHKKIHLSTGSREDMWSIHTRQSKGFLDV